MAFSIVGIFSVLLEVFRPLLPLIIAWIFLDLVLTVYTLKERRFAHATARRWAIWAGAFFMLCAFIAGPFLTQASFANFTATIDWILLTAMSFAVGVAGFLLTLPMASLLKSNR